MKANSIFLTGVATAALLGGFIMATPVFAQYAGNPPQYSSPAERAQTQQLNEQNMNGTTQPRAELNGETGKYGGYQDNQAPPDYEQQQYDQQMQQYQDQQDQYRNDRDQYENQRQSYNRNLRGYDRARWEYAYPRPFADDYFNPRLQRLDLVMDPRRQLWNVPVQGRNGMWVGRIRQVDRTMDGRILRIEIALNRRVSVWVRPWSLRFDPDNRVAFTNLTRIDLWRMPGRVSTFPM